MADMSAVLQGLVILISCLTPTVPQDQASNAPADAAVGSESTHEHTVPSEFHWRDIQSCGVACSFLLLRLTDHDVRYEDVKRVIPVHEDRGSKLADLQAGCRSLGLDTDLVRATSADLDRLTWPVIAHVYRGEVPDPNLGHYIVLLGGTDQFFYCLEPTAGGSLEKMLRGDFLRAWSGIVLVPKTKLSDPKRWPDVAASILLSVTLVFLVLKCWALLRAPRYSGAEAKALLVPHILMLCLVSKGCSPSPGIVAPTGRQALSLTAWETRKDLGLLSLDEEREAKFVLENTGRVAVDIEIGTPSCTCSTIDLEKSRIEPGEKIQLRMGMKNTGRAGAFEATVQVATIGQPWASTFSTRAVALGSSFPNTEWTIAQPVAESAPTVSGVLCTQLDADLSAVEVDVQLVPDDLGVNLVPTVTEPDRHETYSEHAISISLAPLATKLPELTRNWNGWLDVTVRLDGKEQVHRMKVVLVPPVGSLNAGS